jgi:SAM-dependent methyltransferase
MVCVDQYDEKYLEWITREKLARVGLETPAINSLIGNISGKKVLCLGSGSGDECAYIKSLGAKEVIGIDISELFVETSKKKYPELNFQVMDLERLDFKDSSFDFVFSKLAMYYLESWTQALSEVKRVLKKKGTFLFSTHNPVYWAGEKTENDEQTTRIMGYEKNKKTGEARIYGDYLNPRKITDFRSKNFKIEYWHRPFSMLIQDIVNSGLKIVSCLEPKPDELAKIEDLHFLEKTNRLPMFLIFKLEK